MSLSSVSSCVVILLLFISAFPLDSKADENVATTTPKPDLGPWVLIADPTKLERITELLPYTINLTLTYTGIEPTKYATPDAIFVVRISTTNSLTVALDTKQIEFTWEDIVDGNNKTLEVTGQVIGYVDLNFNMDILPKNGSVAAEKDIIVLSAYLVTVIRASDTLDNIFTVVMIIMAVLNTINMGCALDMAIVKQNILRPIGPVVGFISQFTFMPLFSFGLAMLMIDDSLKGFGLLVMGVCPGGLASNFWTLLLDGDVNLSITMTFVSSIAAMGMMPLWLWLLSGYFLPEGSAVSVPYVDMAVSLILLTVPLGIGLLIRRFKLSLAEFLAVKVIKPFSFFFIIFMFGLGFYSMSHIFILLDWTLLAAGLCVTIAGFLFGGLFAWITRLNRPQIIAVSLETAMQNANIAFVLLKTTLPTPYSDIAALPPIAQILMTTSILFVMFGIIMVYKCIQKRRNATDDKKSQKSEEEEETEKSLMMKDFVDGNNSFRSIKTIETPPPNYYGGQIPPEFSWTKRPSLIVPSSPTIDPRIAA